MSADDESADNVGETSAQMTAAPESVTQSTTDDQDEVHGTVVPPSFPPHHEETDPASDSEDTDAKQRPSKSARGGARRHLPMHITTIVLGIIVILIAGLYLYANGNISGTPRAAAMSDCRSSVSHANSARSLLTTAVGDAKTYRASHVTDMSDEQLRNLTSYLDQSAQQPSVPSCSIIANDGVLQTNAVNAKKLAHNATTLTRDLLLATTGVLPQELQGDEQTGDPSYSPSETQMPTESPQPPTSPSTDSSTHGTTSDDAKSHNDSGTANELASPSGAALQHLQNLAGTQSLAIRQHVDLLRRCGDRQAQTEGVRLVRILSIRRKRVEHDEIQRDEIGQCHVIDPIWQTEWSEGAFMCVHMKAPSDIRLACYSPASSAITVSLVHIESICSASSSSQTSLAADRSTVESASGSSPEKSCGDTDPIPNELVSGMFVVPYRVPSV